MSFELLGKEGAKIAVSVAVKTWDRAVLDEASDILERLVKGMDSWAYEVRLV